MKSGRVIEAAMYVDSLKRLRDFRSFYAADPKGVRVSVDGLSIFVSKVANEELVALLAAEETMLLNTLEMFGVEIESDAPVKATR